MRPAIQVAAAFDMQDFHAPPLVADNGGKCRTLTRKRREAAEGARPGFGAAMRPADCREESLLNKGQ